MTPRIALLSLLLSGSVPLAYATATPPKPDKETTTPATTLPALPANTQIRQSIRIGNRTLSYKAIIGALPVQDDKGKTIGDVMFTAYIMKGNNRPVTFALNGGPGASSVYLNIGAIGPKVVHFWHPRHQPIRPRDTAQQPQHLAGLYRSCVHRPNRHRLQPCSH